MKLKEAIENLQELKQTLKTAFWNKEYVYLRVEAIDTVLAELNKQTESYEKGYRQGYNEGYMAGAMEII